MEEAEVSKYDGDKRCYFGVWLLDKVTELHLASEEKFSEQKKGSIVVAYIEQEVAAILKEVDALLDHAKAEGAERVGERILAALKKESFTKDEENGHEYYVAWDKGFNACRQIILPILKS